jgi:hypothetical protein
MTTEFQYDVFLSYNQADKPRVRRLAERLRDAGLRVWFDEWVIQPGDDIHLAIERGLEAARTLVLCLSPAALGSDWVGLERSTVLFRDLANAGRRFIPLLLADCKLPGTLRYESLRRSLFRPIHHTRQKRRATFRLRRTRSLRRVPVELRLHITGIPRARVHRLPRRHRRIAFGGDLIKTLSMNTTKQTLRTLLDCSQL